MVFKKYDTYEGDKIEGVLTLEEMLKKVKEEDVAELKNNVKNIEEFKDEIEKQLNDEKFLEINCNYDEYGPKIPNLRKNIDQGHYTPWPPEEDYIRPKFDHRGDDLKIDENDIDKIEFFRNSIKPIRLLTKKDSVYFIAPTNINKSIIEKYNF